MSNRVFTVQRGSAPLLISLPHVGTTIPADQQQRYTDRALQVEDTDWFLDRLFAFAANELDATLLVPQHSRYLVDLNRPPGNAPMYAGQNNTGLCPTTHFTGEPIYRDGQAPDAAEVARRAATYWQPYHDALQAEAERLRAAHGHVVLFDGHSICSELPWLFDGRLPALNLGTADGSSCAPALRDALTQRLAAQAEHSWVVDGRFKGGYITRQYGRPQHGVHAVQLEMCWRAYIDETPPIVWHAQRAAAVTPLLRGLLQAMLAFRPAA